MIRINDKEQRIKDLQEEKDCLNSMSFFARIDNEDRVGEIDRELEELNFQSPTQKLINLKSECSYLRSYAIGSVGCGRLMEVEREIDWLERFK